LHTSKQKANLNIVAEKREYILIHGGKGLVNTEGCIVIGNKFIVPEDKEKNGEIGFDFEEEWRSNASKNPIFALKDIIGVEGYIKITSGKTNAIRSTI
jgi:hypothetical protein